MNISSDTAFLKAKLKEKRNAMSDLKNQTWELRNQIEKVFWSEIQEGAKTGDIAINRNIADFLLQCRLTLTDDEKADLEVYIKDCLEYRELQKRFSEFYKSNGFQKICDYFASGKKDIGWRANRPRTANSRFRPYNY